MRLMLRINKKCYYHDPFLYNMTTLYVQYDDIINLRSIVHV